MKIYRNHYFTDEESSEGYSFHTSKREALAAAKKFEKDSGRAIRWDIGEDVAEPLILENRTKRELLRFLNQYAGHPNNG